MESPYSYNEMAEELAAREKEKREFHEAQLKKSKETFASNGFNHYHHIVSEGNTPETQKIYCDVCGFVFL